MPARYRIAYLAHALRSDWNNGNAHFLRGLLNALREMGHHVTGFEPADGWSISNLRQEALGEASLAEFDRGYHDLTIESYSSEDADEAWREHLRGFDFVVLHEWNPPALAQRLLRLRDELGFTLLFHDTHHRASSSPEQMELFGLNRFDGVLAFGEALRTIYRERYGLTKVWTLHEAADTAVFHPLDTRERTSEIVWIGNWGDDERSREIGEFLLGPAAALRGEARTTIYGVRYPEQGLRALSEAGVTYGGYLPNLSAPAVYAASRLTVHVPRQQYAGAMHGIPTIRVFEALACGIPLVSAPWPDSEALFQKGDLWMVRDGAGMTDAIDALLKDPQRAAEQAQRGLETVLARHTCRHRAEELTSILKELEQ
jgi:spore maturation protein CgeB